MECCLCERGSAREHQSIVHRNLHLIPMQMEVPVNYALMESSLFLWDVVGGKLSRLRFQGDEAPLIEWIKAKKTEHMKAEAKDDVSQSKWRRTFDLKDGGDVQITLHQ